MPEAEEQCVKMEAFLPNWRDRVVVDQKPELILSFQELVVAQCKCTSPALPLR